MFYSNYSFCVFDDWISMIQNETAKPSKSEKIEQKREFDDLQQNYQILFFCYEGSGRIYVML